MFIPTKQILTKAQKGKYAVGAFNINNMEIAAAIVEAAVLEKSPAILQTSEGSIEYAGMETLVSIANTLGGKTKVPFALHLDHGKDFKIITEAIKLGYQSVMYDGSSFEYSKNVANTKKVVLEARKKGVSVEAEIGALSGIEDFVSVDEKDSTLTNPKEAFSFANETGCDFLAIAIGTSHGAYKFKKASKLDLDRLYQIQKLVKIPLVLHGASSVPKNIVSKIKKLGGKLGDARGVSDSDLKKSISFGIAKVNTDTDLRLAFTLGIRETLFKNPSEFDPRKILKPAYDEMVLIARWKMKLLGSSGKA
jgi:fructose-bisphosphate aldolase, class II